MTMPRLHPDTGIVLPPVEAVDSLDRADLMDIVTQAAAIYARAMARLTLLNVSPSPQSLQEEMLTASEAAGLNVSHSALPGNVFDFIEVEAQLHLGTRGVGY